MSLGALRSLVFVGLNLDALKSVIEFNNSLRVSLTTDDGDVIDGGARNVWGESGVSVLVFDDKRVFDIFGVCNGSILIEFWRIPIRKRET